jgi:hypothetical protein
MKTDEFSAILHFFQLKLLRESSLGRIGELETSQQD